MKEKYTDERVRTIESVFDWEHGLVLRVKLQIRDAVQHRVWFRSHVNNPFDLALAECN